MHRRRFLRRAALGTAVTGGALPAWLRGGAEAGGLPAPAAIPQLGGNEKLPVGFVGCGGRGRTLLDYFLRRKDIEVRGVCDVYEPRLQAAAAAASPTAGAYTDYRELFDRKEIQAVVIATPDHWHARMVIDAVEAGKDAYVEKPLCHTVEEGFSMIDAVARTQRVVQVGTQRRSYDLFLEGKRVFDASGCGKVRLVTSWWYNQQTSLGRGKIEGKLDWKKWLGSAPQRPVDDLRFFNWYYFWDYSGGLMIGQAAHMIDCVNMILGSTYPTAVTAAATPTHLDGAEVPETTNIAVEYADDYLLVFTLGYAAMVYLPPNDLLAQFHGLNARFDIGRENFALYPAPDIRKGERELRASVQKEMYGTFPDATAQHIEDFVACVRRRGTPHATVEIANYTNVALCMAMESIRTGRRIRFDLATKRTS
jgi:predicted dehydrogenase